MSPILRYTISLHFVSVLTTVGLALLFGILNSLPVAPTPSATPPLTHLLASLIGSFAVMALPLLPLCFSDKGWLRRHLTWRAELWRPTLILFLFVLGACWALLTVCSPQEEQYIMQLLAQLTNAQRAAMALILCLLVPWIEEVLFRGILLEAAPPKLALPLSTLLFAFAHGLNAFFLPLFLMGWCLGLLALRTRTLLPGLIIHGAFNLLSLLLL